MSSAGQGGAVRIVSMPKLVGAPAYARPPRYVEPIARPLDLDDLPIEAMRGPDDEAYLASVLYGTPSEAEVITAASTQGGLRSITARLFRSSR